MAQARPPQHHRRALKVAPHPHQRAAVPAPPPPATPPRAPTAPPSATAALGRAGPARTTARVGRPKPLPHAQQCHATTRASVPAPRLVHQCSHAVLVPLPRRVPHCLLSSRSSCARSCPPVGAARARPLRLAFFFPLAIAAVQARRAAAATRRWCSSSPLCWRVQWPACRRGAGAPSGKRPTSGPLAVQASTPRSVIRMHTGGCICKGGEAGGWDRDRQTGRKGKRKRKREGEGEGEGEREK